MRRFLAWLRDDPDKYEPCPQYHIRYQVERAAEEVIRLRPDAPYLLRDMADKLGRKRLLDAPDNELPAVLAELQRVIQNT